MGFNCNHQRCVSSAAQDARRSLSNLNGHLNGVALTDAGYYYFTNGNGTWSQARSVKTYAHFILQVTGFAKARENFAAVYN